MTIQTAIELLQGRRIAVLSGAGVSTASGIPDYRSPEALAQGPRRPIQGPEFLRSEQLRARYWARAMAGWETFRLARPNQAHHALAALEHAGVVTDLITQNVDRLHHAAGSRRVTELHGALADVVCLDCPAEEDRDSVQSRMCALNPGWLDGPTPMAPDGDADLADDLVERFIPPACLSCGGALKPKVVFFGDHVARPVVEAAYAQVDRAEVLLVTGTSLHVFSGYRFLLRASEQRLPIVIVNRGPVRGEERAAFKLEASAEEALSQIAAALGAGDADLASSRLS